MGRRTSGLALAAAVALAVGIAGAAAAAEPHSHGGHAAAPGLELTLDHGRKWHTDEALRRGMAEMRRQAAASLPLIHERRFVAADYERLAAGIESQIDYVTANCKLSPEADMQLHVVLAEIIDAVGAMREKRAPEEGAVKLAQALDAYAAHFEHPGWEKLLD